MIVLKSQDLQQVIESLKIGSVIIYPTETCYGLGGDATNPEVVEKIYKIKQRREEKPFLVIAPDVEMAKEYLEWSLQLDEIAKKYWPGAVTVVSEGKSKSEKDKRLTDGIIAPDGTVAMRVTAHPVAAELARALGRPLISTSANISGREPSYSAEEVIKMFVPMKYGIPYSVGTNQPDQPDILLDYGVLPQNPPTTIVRVVDGKISVLRKGGIEVESSCG